jgi:hypothetical protein
MTLTPGEPTALHRSVSYVIWLNGCKPQLSLLPLAHIVLNAGLPPACSPGHSLIPVKLPGLINNTPPTNAHRFRYAS